ncbi:rhomboid-like protein [Actinocrispum wychmicini]|uniref:rhomboid-like protein n=1 Tax=Actinocrispum wychmicini TaxID=1213861 RepID=UPI001045F942|nr:rhomboid-like protein [Actinocrispum wychmicini]
MTFVRRNPGTVAYLALLLAGSLVVFGILPDDAADDALRSVSTNLANVDWLFPLRLLASGLVADPSAYTLVLVLAGVIGSMGWLERRFGAARAFGIFLAVHIGVTLLTLLVVVVGVRTGFYPPAVRDDLDYGISYGAIGCAAAVTGFLPRWARVPAALVVLFVPFVAAEWYGWVPDFATIGHVLSALAGFVTSAVLVRRRTVHSHQSSWGNARTDTPVCTKTH